MSDKILTSIIQETHSLSCSRNFDGKSPSDCTDDATNTSHNDDDDKDSTAADDNPEILLATSDLIKAIATGDHKTFASLIGIVESNKKLNVWGLGLVTPAGELILLFTSVTVEGNPLIIS